MLTMHTNTLCIYVADPWGEDHIITRLGEGTDTLCTYVADPGVKTIGMCTQLDLARVQTHYVPM